MFRMKLLEGTTSDEIEQIPVDRLEEQANKPLPKPLIVSPRVVKDPILAEPKQPAVQPIIWHGTVDEYRSVLLIKEAELVAATAQLTGNTREDWYTKNRILVLEQYTTNLRTWLSAALKRAENTHK